MSTRERSPGSVFRAALQAVRPGESVEYRCGLCDLTFEDERLNCPACGGPVREE